MNPCNTHPTYTTKVGPDNDVTEERINAGPYYSKTFRSDGNERVQKNVSREYFF